MDPLLGVYNDLYRENIFEVSVFGARIAERMN